MDFPVTFSFFFLQPAAARLNTISL